MQPLQVFATIAAAYRDVWNSRRDLFLLAYLPALAAAFAQLAILGPFIPTLRRVMQARPTPDMAPEAMAALQGDLSTAMMVMLAFGLVWISFGVLFAVAWYRRTLLPDERPTVASALAWRGRHWRFLARVVQLGLIALVVVWVGGVLAASIGGAVLSAAGGGSAGLFALLLWMVTALVVMRLAMVFPATAIDVPCNLQRSWRMTRGRAGALFIIVLAAVLPMLALQLTFELNLAIALGPETLYATLPLFFLVALGEQAIAFIGWALLASALSIVWRALGGETPGGVAVPVPRE
ncbi:MAG: hypothetical protein AB7N54_19710 [Alphaproteobacteria bacterium]